MPKIYATLLFFGIITLAATTGAATEVEAEGQKNRPNIVLIMTDDQGHGDLGVTGNPILQTPNIDAMSQRSASLSRFYVSPVCAPTRACLMTGRYNYRTRVVDTWRGRAMMEPSEVTVAEGLRDVGYATGIFGKWHLGDCYPMRAMDQGFEHSLVHCGGGLGQPSEPPENRHRYTDAILFRNGKQVQTKGYCTDVYFDEAMQFMTKSHNTDRPFFAYIATNAPHTPVHDVPEDLYQKYRKTDLSKVTFGNKKMIDQTARIYAMIENIDQNVGRLFKKLGELGIERETLVIFMVDNGPNGQRYVSGLRGHKASVYEGGIRSPFFAHWPERLKAGQTADHIAAHIDVMPTLLDVAGAKPSSESKLDGRSLLPLLEGKTTDWPDRSIVIQSHRGARPVPRHQFAVIHQKWKLVRPSRFSRASPLSDAPYELYDIEKDPGEKTDLAGKHSKLVAALKTEYDQWLEDVSSTRKENYAPPRIVIGTDHETETTLTWQDWQATGQGWGEGGKWLLHVAEPNKFSFTVLMLKEEEGTAILKLGDQEVEMTSTTASKQMAIKGIALPAGDVDISFLMQKDDKKVVPYQIIIKRQS